MGALTGAEMDAWRARQGELKKLMTPENIDRLSQTMTDRFGLLSAQWDLIKNCCAAGLPLSAGQTQLLRDAFVDWQGQGIEPWVGDPERMQLERARNQEIDVRELLPIQLGLMDRMRKTVLETMEPLKEAGKVEGIPLGMANKIAEMAGWELRLRWELAHLPKKPL